MQTTLRVLAVDDDPAAKVIFGAIGHRYGFEVVVAATAQSALEALETSEFDVILMDWRLPDMDGMDCVRIIRRRQAEKDQYIPVIAVTANALEGDREKCLSADCDDYVAKPYKIDNLNDAIQTWGKRGVELRESRQASLSVCVAETIG